MNIETRHFEFTLEIASGAKEPLLLQTYFEPCEINSPVSSTGTRVYTPEFHHTPRRESALSEQNLLHPHPKKRAMISSLQQFNVYNRFLSTR